MRTDTKVLVGFGIWAGLVFLGWVAFWGTILWVGFHFVSKWW